MVETKEKYGFEPDYAIPPGETLKETIESIGMTQKELSIRTGLTVQSINRIYKGEQPIIYETANKLELVTGVPARFWNNLEAKYREQLEKSKELDELNNNLDWLKIIPIGELKKRGVVAKTSKQSEQVRDALKFFGVSNVSAWKEIWTEPKVAARRSACFESMPGHAATWIRQGELIAQKIPCAPYDKNCFKEAIAEIRKLTVEDPKKFGPKMTELCAQAGVALSLVPEMKKVPWSGATKWLRANKAMIIINLRGKSEDKFWFSFFHEAGHVLNDNKKKLYINDESDDPVEVRANDFAASVLFPGDSREIIPSLTTKLKIKLFAQKIGLSPGIVAGQFQFLTEKWTWYHGLIRKFVWNNE
ncbi:ImmA/IrrE family metallo-endopeptidase [Desulfobacula sp.]|uniref:ImmA/IrrE family metallo-endopeptidase n=1 Tax=Desulfobacula sp. TaxID=2593537 RepID=UPI0025C2F57B|nr:ImmA/IrrE family metallo-endopeptidase [Desulfobacula sp.]MBC2705545.1 ImmA/IrrE family metallo-endopeptidase [Desulfobacula sp.]